MLHHVCRYNLNRLHQQVKTKQSPRLNKGIATISTIYMTLSTSSIGWPITIK